MLAMNEIKNPGERGVGALQYTCVRVFVGARLVETKCNYVMLRVAVRLIISNERQNFRNGELSLAFAEFPIP